MVASDKSFIDVCV